MLTTLWKSEECAVTCVQHSVLCQVKLILLIMKITYNRITLESYPMEKLLMYIQMRISLFLTVGCLLVQWTFHPFIFKAKKIYTVLLWCRVLAFLVVRTDELSLFYLAFAKNTWIRMRMVQ